MDKYQSIANNAVLKHFRDQRGKTLMNLAQNTCSIENAIASLLCPEIVEERGYIFISEFYNNDIGSLEKLHDYDKKKIEMLVNSWSLSELILGDESLLKDPIVEEFGKVIKYFWEMRFKALFPNRNIVVEIGARIMGESGLTVTVYQND